MDPIIQSCLARPHQTNGLDHTFYWYSAKDEIRVVYEWGPFFGDRNYMLLPSCEGILQGISRESRNHSPTTQIPVMSEKVHPAGDSPSTAGKMTLPPEKSTSQPGSYVIQVPKDQVYRYPPPESARRPPKPRRSSCCRCICWTLGLLVLALVLVAVAAGILYLVFRPEIPEYSIDDLSIKGFNLSRSSDQASLTLSPEFTVTVRAENPNKKIGIYYEKGSSVSVLHSDVELCRGVLPVFFQGSKNVTVFQTALKGDGIVLTGAEHGALITEQRGGKIPLELDLKVPVRVRFGAVKTWKVTVKVRCDVIVDKMTEKSKIVSRTCKVNVDVF